MNSDGLLPTSASVTVPVESLCSSRQVPRDAQWTPSSFRRSSGRGHATLSTFDKVVRWRASTFFKESCLIAARFHAVNGALQ
mmetsp:Transcript_64794/g.171491  ORF Transcript_64794/g.171491 Transcript_64794/m.171491 type:complete len:82 (+) Transcript_64794:285-530(+)